jgi:hypothetical protein
VPMTDTDRHQLVRSLAFTAGAIVALFLIATAPVTAEDPVICERRAPTAITGVRGFTWSGIVTRAHANAPVEFTIDHVYAQRVDEESSAPKSFKAGGTLVLANNTCQYISGFEAGGRYLVSTYRLVASGPDSSYGPTSETTVAWEIGVGPMSLVDMYENVHQLAPQLRQATTIADVLELVAPNAPPPTDTPIAEPAPPGDLVPPLVLGSGLAVGGWLTRRLRSRGGRSGLAVLTGLPRDSAGDAQHPT